MQKVGILGGGQLGRMLLQAAANYPVETHVLENDDECPAAHLCRHFTKGSIRDFDTVCRFGKSLDAVTIEIENVNVAALEQLEREGVKIYPAPSVLRIIKNKIDQKEYYARHGIPTAPFVITQTAQDLPQYERFLPAVHKSAEGGYDGRGVLLMNGADDLRKGFDGPGVLEKKVAVKKEIAQIVAVDGAGRYAVYPPVEMVFHPVLNLLDYQLCPAELPPAVLQKIESVSLSVVRPFRSPGLFAVELFVDENDGVLVNETAPRVHNSGHHTIEAHYSSQFDMLWRIMLGYPLGHTGLILPSVMMNVIGSDGHRGNAKYVGIDEVLAMENAFLHLYGKRQTQPGRKMGHVTILGTDKTDLLRKAGRARQAVSVVA